MTSDALAQILVDIRDSLSRGKGSFGLAREPSTGKAMLAAGAPSQVKVGGGRIVMIGLSAEQVRHLRDQCDAFLAGTAPS